MQWFESVPHLLTEQEWEVRERAGLSSLSHCHCPWGGRLLKLTLSGIRVQHAGTLDRHGCLQAREAPIMPVQALAAPEV